MTSQQKRIMIGELIGQRAFSYNDMSDVLYYRENETVYKFPQYTENRDAMHKAISEWEKRDFTACHILYTHLLDVMQLHKGQEWEVASATAEQLADAFLLGHKVNPYAE
jgi:F0F1-type ATP synthase gamma subunit